MSFRAALYIKNFLYLRKAGNRFPAPTPHCQNEPGIHTVVFPLCHLQRMGSLVCADSHLSPSLGSPKTKRLQEYFPHPPYFILYFI
jgi:hypothetical protein